MRLDALVGCLKFGVQMIRERERKSEREKERGRERGRGKEIEGGSELKRLVLPNEVNTPSGRMRLPCRAETVVTSVILYKAAGWGEARVNCRRQDSDEGRRNLKGVTLGRNLRPPA